jgi:putative peptide zinc metalloprotease protein
VVLGPALRSGPSVVHHVKDARTGGYYRVGPREYFIMRRMDGDHTLDDIGREYAEAYGRALGPDSWRQMFALLGRHRLLEGMAGDAELDRLARERADRNPRPGTWWHRRWVLLEPDRLCAALADRLSFAFHPVSVALALAAVVALQAYVWTRAGALFEDATHPSTRPAVIPLTLVLLLVVTLFHEFGHGVALRHFGGSVTEIGIRWRLPVLAAYCRTDDVLLLHRRTARVGTAFAGVLVNLLVLLPVPVWWRLTEEGQLGHSLSASLLLFGSGGALVNLLPFLRLDGSVMLNHALGTADLQGDSRRFWRLRLSRRTPAVQDRLRAYPARDARLYTLYGIACSLFAVLVYSCLMWVWYGSLQRWVGPLTAVLVLAAETVVLAGVLAYAARGRTSERKTADG